uniref:Uncharacterized protein n=1 Tax=Oryza barthii TaxID=65489 RepID=A0A0D3FJ45_9ORYZ
MPDLTKPPSPRPRRRRCRLCGICLGTALLALLVSSLAHLFSPPQPQPQPPRPSPSSSPPRFAVIIDGGSTGSRAHVFATGPGGRPDLARSAVMRVTPGLSSFADEPARAGDSLRPLINFAREKVGGAAAEVRLMATAGLRLQEGRVQEAILSSCRDVLRASGFRFEDSWAEVIPGSDEGIYAWVAANYALGTLGGDPHKTIGIIELGGASAQLTFVSDEVLPPELSRNFTFGGTTYTLYSNSFLNFGQNAAQESFREILRSKDSKNGTLVDPCAPKGYSRIKEVISRPSSASKSKLENQFADSGDGDFTFFGLKQSSSLSDFVLAGEQFCNKDLSTLRQMYPNRSDDDFSRYCFSSAYIVALLHDSLGVPLDDKRQEYHGTSIFR